MNQAIQDFIECRRIAVVGASRGAKKFGNLALSELKAHGYETFVVHPQAREIGGEPCHPSLAALTERVDGVFVCVPPRQAVQVLREAAAAGIRKVWLQQGAASPEVLAVAQELGLEAVHGKCVLLYLPPVRSYHRWHRAVEKLIGRL